MKLGMREISFEQKWNAFVLKYAPYALFQSWSWGAVIGATKRHFWRMGWFEGGTLMAVALVEKIPARRGAFLHVRHGPILAAPSKKNWSQVVDSLKHMARGEHVLFVRMSPQIEHAGPTVRILSHLGGKPAPIHAMDAEYCFVLDVRPGEEELLAAMRKTTRYEIKRAQKLGVVIEQSTNPADIATFDTLYALTSARHQFVKHLGIREEFEVFAKEGHALLLNASHEGKVLASAVILFWGSEAIYHHGASIPGKIPASYLLQWEAIREAKKRGCVLYNFWGIAPEGSTNHPWQGITTFKTGFGGYPMKFSHAMDFPVSPFYFIPHTVESIRKHIKGY